MKKSSVIEYFGQGNVQLAATNLGITKQAISLWATDPDGNILSERVRDAVIARGFRLRARSMHAKGKLKDRIEADLADIDLDAADAKA